MEIRGKHEQIRYCRQLRRKGLRTLLCQQPTAACDDLFQRLKFVTKYFWYRYLQRPMYRARDLSIFRKSTRFFETLSSSFSVTASALENPAVSEDLRRDRLLVSVPDEFLRRRGGDRSRRSDLS